MAAFKQLINTARKVHNPEINRSEIFTDLAAITREEYLELEKGKFVSIDLDKQVWNILRDNSISDYDKLFEITKIWALL